MATILAHIQIREGREAAFEETAQPLFARSHAEETGLLRYEYWRGEAKGRYYVLLAFDDYAAFMRHQTSDHHEAAAPALQEAIQDIRLEWLSPVPGASPLPSLTSPDLPQDATELMCRYAATFPMAFAEWWPRENPAVFKAATL